jgi:hypothetical protein
VPKSLSRRRSQKAENTNEYVHFKEFFGETGLLDDSERFQSFIEDLAQNGFADEMAKQINSKMTTASHNSSFQNYIVDDIISNASLNKAICRIDTRNALNEISNVVNVVNEKSNSTLLEEASTSQSIGLISQFKDNINNTQIDPANPPFCSNQALENSCFYSNNIGDYPYTETINEANGILPDINDDNSQNVIIRFLREN